MGKAEKRKKELLRLDLGCGPNPQEGFIGVDIIDFGKNKVYDLRNKEAWKWIKDQSVIQIHTSHFVEHLTAAERTLFANECYRIMTKDATMQLVCPHWSSARAYGDPTHVWPPISEFWFQYLNKEWRLSQAPHTDEKNMKNGLNCDFEITYGYGLRQDILLKSQETQQFAIMNYKEVCLDIVATFKRKG